MKGLYVYGALLMALTFGVGVVAGSPLVMFLALASCALAALGEAGAELCRSGMARHGDRLVAVVNGIALASWVTTAIAAVAAALSLLGLI